MKLCLKNLLREPNMPIPSVEAIIVRDGKLLFLSEEELSCQGVVVVSWRED